jgi:hypothetical protein
MHFNEKINLLMKMANTTNSKLAAALNVDPSLISRWRTGAREPGDDSRYIQQIGVYFASQARQDFQRVALLELTGHQMEDKNVSESVIATYLNRWLSNEAKISSESVQVLLDSIGTVGETLPPSPDVPFPTEPHGQSVDFQTFSGHAGLRSATIKLLIRALQSERVNAKMLLFSDEPMDWIVENPIFARQWYILMSTCIRRGLKINVIHTLSRDSNELAIAVQRWLPFYMTGAIVSYYYPEKRDDLFHHTAFVIEGEAVVSSTSVRGQGHDTVQYLYTTDPASVKAAEITFETQRLLCKPLVRTYTGEDTQKFIDEQLNLFTSYRTKGIGMQSLLINGMPLDLLESMLIREQIPPVLREELLENQSRRLKASEEHLKHTPFQLVISLPRITDVLKGRVPALVPELLTHRKFTYHPMEYHAHLMALIDMLAKYKQLDMVILPNKHMLHTVQLFAMDQGGLLVMKHRDPKFVFISEQHDLISAVMSYINQETLRIPKRERNKTFVIEKLRAFAQRIAQGSQQRMLP